MVNCLRRRVFAAREELMAALTDWPEAERQRHVDRLYPAYLLRVDLAHKVAHAALLREVDRVDRRLATEIRLLPFEAVTEITIIAADHPDYRLASQASPDRVLPVRDYRDEDREPLGPRRR